MSPTTEAVAFPRHAVTAVLVAHDGVRWLPSAINGLVGQTRPVQQIVAVDTGSEDGSADLLVDAFGVDAVIRRKRNTGFGAAVAYGVNSCERIDHAAFAEAMGGFGGGFEPPAPQGEAVGRAARRRARQSVEDPAHQTPGDRYRQQHGLADTADDDGFPDDPHGDFPDGDLDEAGQPIDRWNAYAADGAGRPGSGGPSAPAGVVEWIWLLHDDCEPAPEALWRLLAVAETHPTAGVIGPKVRSWYDQRHLLEVGVTIAANGGRWTGLERREQDQGQHDQVRDVLAVGSAGMLVRRDVWDQLQGFDRALTLMRDDVDFCWRANAAGHRVLVAPEAVVRHAEAASHERRPVDATVDRPHLVDRSHSIYVLLANLPARQLPWALLRLVLSTLARTVAYLVGKLPGMASDEFFGLLAALSRPDRLARGRRQRARTRQRGVAELRELFPPRWSGARYVMERVYTRFGQQGPAAEADGGRHRAVESGPTADEAEDLDSDSLAWLRRLLRRPGFLLVTGLLLITGLACRALLTGGRLAGGALLPSPTGAGDLWSAYLGGWHPVSFGSSAGAPPYLAVVAMLATLALGHASLAVTALMLGSVPLAGLTAYIAAGRLVASRLLRVWAALAYALLPTATGALSGGRLGTAVAITLLPLLGIGMVAALGETGRIPPTRAAWATGFGLALASAFAPFAWVLTAVVGLIAVGAARGEARIAGRLLIILAVPVATLLPWSLSWFADPATLLTEVGATNGLAGQPATLGLLLANPGGPGTFPVLLTGGLVLAALGALLRDDRRRPLVAGWVVALTGLFTAVLANRIPARGSRMSDSIHVWPGLSAALMGAGLIVAVLIGAEDVRDRVAASSFGWRQPVTLLIALAAAVAPALAMGWWVTLGAAGPLHRQSPTQVPAYVAAEAQTPDRPRTLALRASPGGGVSFALLRDGGATLGAEELKPTRAESSQLDAAVASVLSGKGGGETAQLGQYGVRYVLAVAPVDGDLVQTLDGVPGLVRISEQGGSFMWQNTAPSARLRLVAGDVKGATSQNVASTGAIGTTTVIPAGDTGRQLLVAERFDSRWRATLNGQRLDARMANGWQQSFAVPAAGGTLRLWHDNTARSAWVGVEATLAVIALVMALPSGRRRDDEDELAAAAPGAGEIAVDEAPLAEPGAGSGRRGRRGRRAAPEPEPGPESELAEGAADDWPEREAEELAPAGQPEYQQDPFADHQLAQDWQPADFRHNAEPDLPEPRHPESVFPEPVYSPPVYSDPAYAEPAYPDQGYSEPEFPEQWRPAEPSAEHGFADQNHPDHPDHPDYADHRRDHTGYPAPGGGRRRKPPAPRQEPERHGDFDTWSPE